MESNCLFTEHSPLRSSSPEISQSVNNAKDNSKTDTFISGMQRGNNIYP